MEPLSSTNHPSSGKVEESRDWKNLPTNAMVTILVILPHSDVLKSVQFVCNSWHESSKDPDVWRKIDFGETTTTKEEYQKMTFSAIDRSCGCLHEIRFEFYGNDPLLLHMAQLSSQLRCLRIQCCDEISDKALCEAIDKLPLLKEVELTLCIVNDSTIRSIGQCCPDLVSFKLNKRGLRNWIDIDNTAAIAIAETMSGIHHLQLIGNTMTNKGLQTILDSCSCLESLDIRGCFHVDLSGKLGKRCADIMVKDGDWPHILIDDDSDSEDDFFFDKLAGFPALQSSTEV